MDRLALASLMMIASGSIHAIVNGILKGGSDKMASRAVIDGSSALIVIPAAFFVPAPHGAWEWLVASALVHGIYLYALIRAFETSDLSAAYPILRGSAPLITAAVTLGWLGESATVQEVVGIAVIGVAMFVMVAGCHVSRAGLGWALLTGVTVAIYTVIDSYGVRAAPTPIAYIVWLFITMGVVVVTMLGIASRGTIFRSARAQWRPGAAAGALSILSYGLALHAFSLGPTAPLAALRETGMITALLISILVLKEQVNAARLAGVLGILAGAVLILTG